MCLRIFNFRRLISYSKRILDKYNQNDNDSVVLCDSPQKPKVKPTKLGKPTKQPSEKIKQDNTDEESKVEG